MPRLTESRSARLKSPETGQAFEWCSEVKGFGVRLTPGSKSYVVQLRLGEKTLRLTLGPVGVLPFEGPPHAQGARDLALAALNAARLGKDPRAAIGLSKEPDGVPLNTIWKTYEEAGQPKLKGVGKKRESTARTDRQRYNLLIKPALGSEAVHLIDTARVRRWLDTISTEGQRSHALVLVKALLSFARSRGLATPAEITIKATKSKEVQNFYRAEELQLLDATLVGLIAERPKQVLPFSALRLLIFTGARLGEILSLQWENVNLDNGVLHLEKDKTSENRRDILLTPAAVAVLGALPRRGNCQYVFFSDSARGYIVDVQKPFLEAVARAGLRRIRKHDLRHSFASAAIRLGVPLYTVGKLLGHKQAMTTQRYAHLEHDVAREALERVAKAISPIGGGK